MKARINLQSIKSKLIMAFIGSMMIISLVCVAFIWFEYEEAQLVKLRDQLNHIDVTIRDMELAQQNFIHFEGINPEFYETGHSYYHLTYRSLSIALVNELTDVGKQTTLNRFNLKNVFEDISQQTQLLNSKFDTLYQLIKERGFKDYGVEGEMRDYIHRIEDSPQRVNLAKILMIRRHEKDFIIRKDLKYVEKLKTAVLDLQQDIAFSIQDLQAKRELLDWLDNYRNKFLQMVEYDQRIGMESQNGLVSELAKQSLNLKEKNQDFKREINNAARLSTKAMRSTLTVLLIGFFVLNIALSFFVFRELGQPINKLSFAIRSTIEQEFAERKPIVGIKRKDEIGGLARDFDWMINKVQEQTTNLTNKNHELTKSYDNLTILSQIGKKIIANLNIRDIIETTYQSVHELINSEVFAIGVYQPENNCLYFYGKKGQEEEVLEGSDSLDDDSQLSNWCFKNQSEILINDFCNEYQQYLPELRSRESQV